ncbi:unnamed protein product [Closterium sp. NIES-53]
MVQGQRMRQEVQVVKWDSTTLLLRVAAELQVRLTWGVRPDAFFRSCTQVERLSLGCLHANSGLPALLFRLAHLRSLAVANLSAILATHDQKFTALAALAINTAISRSPPFSFACLSSLTLLDLGFSPCPSFDRMFPAESPCTLLKRLSLYQCGELHTLPDDMSEHLPCLRELSITMCDTLLEQLDQVTSLTALCPLKLAECSFCGLPDRFGQMPTLTTLVLHKLNIHFPALFSRLQSLETLVVTDCSSLAELPDGLGALTVLKSLCVAECPSMVLPADVGQLTNLHTLFLKSCSAPHLLLPSFTQLASLALLELHECDLAELPEATGELRRLQELLEALVVDECSNLFSVPTSLINLAQLKQLELTGCALLRKAPNLASLEHLKIMLACEGEFPFPLADLPCLRTLTLINTGVVHLPDLPCRCGGSRSNSSGLSSSSGSGSNTGGRICSSGGFSCSARSNLHSGALTDPTSTHTGASEVLSVGAAATTRLVPAFVTGSGATSPTARLSFTLDSRASSYFFRDCTDLTPLHTLVTVALADPSVGSVVADSTTILRCPVVPSGFLTGYYTPSFSRYLMGVSHLHDLGVVTTFPLHEPVASCTLGATGAPLATFHREPGSGLYSLHTGSYHTGSGQVRSGQVSQRRLPRFLARLRHRALPVSRVGSALPLTPRSPPPRLPYRPCTWTDAWPRMTPIFLWTGFPGVAADYRVWGCLAHVRALGVNKLSACTRACVFLGFPLNTSGWVFYDPVTHQFFASQDVTFDESVSYYRSRPHRGSEAFSPPLFPTLEPLPSRPSSPTPFASFPVRCVASHSAVFPPAASSPVMSGGAGGVVAESEGTGAVGARCASSEGAEGVRVETTPEEDTAVSTQWPRPASPPGFPSVL